MWGHAIKLPYKPANKETSVWVEELEDYVYRILPHDRPQPCQQNKIH